MYSIREALWAALASPGTHPQAPSRAQSKYPPRTIICSRTLFLGQRNCSISFYSNLQQGVLGWLARFIVVFFLFFFYHCFHLPLQTEVPMDCFPWGAHPISIDGNDILPCIGMDCQYRLYTYLSISCLLWWHWTPLQVSNVYHVTEDNRGIWHCGLEQKTFLTYQERSPW